MNKTKSALLLASLAAATGLSPMNAASAEVRVDNGYVQVVSRGWHGDRYYDGHRYWRRREWERRHPPRHRRAPPRRYY